MNLVGSRPPIKPGITCLLSSACNAWRDNGVNVDESTLFLIGAGNKIDCRLEYKGNSPLIFVGHHSAEILQRFCKRMSVKHSLVAAPSSLEDLEDYLKSKQENGVICIAWVEMSRLPYIDTQVPSGSMHAINIEQIEPNEVVVADCFVTQGIYSSVVSTHRERIRLVDFVAWERTGYLLHEIESDFLDEKMFCLSDSELATYIEEAAVDFLKSLEFENSSNTSMGLLNLVAILPDLYRKLDLKARVQCFHSMAYSLKYFGFLWSRAFLASVFLKYAGTKNIGELKTLAETLNSSVKSWKAIIYLSLKVGTERSNFDDVERLCEAMKKTILAERQAYQDFLSLGISGSPAKQYLVPQFSNDLSAQFGFGCYKEVIE